VHGVYKPGNVKLQPQLLQKHQAYVKDKTGVRNLDEGNLCEPYTDFVRQTIVERG
jgi:hypothetical protein